MSDSTPIKRTPLYGRHVELGGKMVPFAGWEMPVQYSGVIAEHHAVRQSAGIFDVSHMGEIWVTGPNAEATLDWLTCNDVKALVDGKAQYSALINEQGGVVDDIIIYRYSRDRFFVCVNASNTDKDFGWMTYHNRFKADIKNVSSEYGQIAVQGPKAAGIVASLISGSDVRTVRYFHFEDHKISGVPVILARTGYSGEDGFELFIPANETVKIWDLLLEAGNQDGLIPAGLGARDSLRLEACLPLHGHELGDNITAIESGLGWIVKPQKGDFCGRAILAEQKANGAPRALVGFYVDDPGIARAEDKIVDVNSGEQIGIVTSGTKTPTVNKALGLALIRSDHKALETKIAIEVRGRKLAAHVTKTPFYKR